MLTAGCSRAGFYRGSDARPQDAPSSVDSAARDGAQDGGALDSPAQDSPAEGVDAAVDGPVDSAASIPDLLPGTNLLVNGSCESLASSEGIVGWTAVTCPQEWVCTNAGQINQPQDGQYLFFPVQCSPAHLEQIVDVSAWASTIDQQTQRFRFSGWVSNWQDTRDTAQVVVQYLATASTAPLEEYDSSPLAQGTWQEITDERLAPAGTRLIRVELIATRYDGSDNDGYFDNLRLEALAP